jgi:hypothetical protein
LGQNAQVSNRAGTTSNCDGAQAQQPPKEPMIEEQKPAQGARQQQQPQSESKPKEEQGERAKSGQPGQSEVKPGKDNQRSEQSEKSVKPEGAGKPGNDQAGSGGSAAQEKQRAEKSGDGAKGESPKRHAGKKLEAKQRTVVRESLGKRNMRPTKVNFSISVGTVVPRTVVLYDLPDTLIEFEPEYRRYKFIMSDDNTILVIDPETWEIVDVIEI